MSFSEDAAHWFRRPEYYDPDGNPMSEKEFAKLWFSRSGDDPDNCWWRRRTEIPVDDDEPIVVSTVWTGMDASLPITGEEQPLFWETMIFGGEHDHDHVRYSSREQAYARHEWIVTAIKDGTDPDAELAPTLKEE